MSLLRNFAGNTQAEKCRIIRTISKSRNVPIVAVCDAVRTATGIWVDPSEVASVAAFVPTNTVGAKTSQFSGEIPAYGSRLSTVAAERMRRWNR